MAMYIKDEFEKKYGVNWSCIVSIKVNYGSRTYYKSSFFSFCLGEYIIILFAN